MSGYRPNGRAPENAGSAWTDERALEWVDAHVEAYVDGELSNEDRRRLEACVDSSPNAADMLRLAGMVRNGLGRIESPVCPPEVTFAVLAQARQDVERAPTPATLAITRFRTRVDEFWAHILRPSLAAAALVAVVAAGALVGRTPPPDAGIAAVDPATVEFEQADVEQALREAKWALAFVSDVSREAGQSIRKNVLEDRVAAPIQRALGTAFDEEPTS